MEDNLMTAEGRETLRAEIERLERDERARIAEQIRVARGFGDLKENAEYHAAKEAQAHLETRIASLRQRLLHARVVEVAEGDVIAFGSSVVLVDEGTGRELRYTLVAQHEQDPAQGLLSVETPVAAALIGRRAGEVATVSTPRGERRLRVESVG